MSATAQLRDFERISFQEDFIMSGFGKRQIVSTPVRSDASGPAGEAGLTADRLPFSFIGLAGAAAVSAALMLWSSVMRPTPALAVLRIQSMMRPR